MAERLDLRVLAPHSRRASPICDPGQPLSPEALLLERANLLTLTPRR